MAWPTRTLFKDSVIYSFIDLSSCMPSPTCWTSSSQEISCLFSLLLDVCVPLHLITVTSWHEWGLFTWEGQFVSLYNTEDIPTPPQPLTAYTVQGEVWSYEPPPHTHTQWNVDRSCLLQILQRPIAAASSWLHQLYHDQKDSIAQHSFPSSGSYSLSFPFP